jgi:GH25 family lysozyme M1 (1,4-beta-N-acetylmuramidase)
MILIINLDVEEEPDYDLLSANGVRAVIIRATQGNTITSSAFREQYAMAKKQGWLVGLSHLLDPACTTTGKKEANYFYNIVKDLDFDFLQLEFSKWWDSFGKVQGTKLDSRMTLAYTQLKDRLSVDNRSSRPVVIYTSKNFVETYSPRSNNQTQLRKMPLHLAYWHYPEGEVKMEWNNLWSPCWFPTWSPPLPTNSPGYSFFNFTGEKFILPGLYKPANLSLWNSSWKMLQRWCGKVYTDEPGGEFKVTLPVVCNDCVEA